MECILLYEGFTVLLFYTLHGRPHEIGICPLEKVSFKELFQIPKVIIIF